MKTVLELNEMILGITNKIRERDPELLKYLNEMPITVPYQENPEITAKTLTTYYDSLVGIFEGYEQGHIKNKMPENVQILPTTEITTMESANSYHNLLTVVNNITISYNEAGEGNIPVIFLHGFPFDKSMWKGQLDSLKCANRVIALDIRGFGKSIDENTHLSIEQFGSDLVSFMDKLNIEKAIICGLSMGGYVALNAIKRFPERFNALILCDTQCIDDTEEVKAKRFETIDQINIEGATAFNDKFIKSVFHPSTIADKKELVESLRSIVFANSKTIITAGLTALAQRAETCSILNTIHVPTLIICGRQDEVTPLVQSELMHKHIVGSKLKIIDNAGHVSNLEHPEEFNKYMLEFLLSLNTSY